MNCVNRLPSLTALCLAATVLWLASPNLPVAASQTGASESRTQSHELSSSASPLPSPTLSPTPTPPPTPTPTPPLLLTLPQGTFAVVDPPPGTAIPEGYAEVPTSLNGRMVPAFQAMKGGLVLFYLERTAGGSGFYYFNSQRQAYARFFTLALPPRAYSVLEPEAGVAVPAGFSQAELALDGQLLPAWLPDQPDPRFNGREMFLLYLMDSQGGKRFYLYDRISKTLGVYQAAALPSPTPQATPAVSASPSPQPVSPAEPFNPWQLVSLLLGLLAFFLTGTVVWLAVLLGQNRRRYRGSVRVEPVQRSGAEPPLTAAAAAKQPDKARPPRIRRVD
jgi:hypothetical protein